MSAPSPYFAGAKIKPQESGLPWALVLMLLSRISSLAAVLEAGGAGEGACGTPERGAADQPRGAVGAAGRGRHPSLRKPLAGNPRPSARVVSRAEGEASTGTVR